MVKYITISGLMASSKSCDFRNEIVPQWSMSLWWWRRKNLQHFRFVYILFCIQIIEQIFKTPENVKQVIWSIQCQRSHFHSSTIHGFSNLKILLLLLLITCWISVTWKQIIPSLPSEIQLIPCSYEHFGTIELKWSTFNCCW